MVTERILTFIIITIVAFGIILGMLRLFHYFGNAGLAMIIVGIIISFTATVLYASDALQTKNRKRDETDYVSLSQRAKNTLLIADIIGLALIVLGAI